MVYCFSDYVQLFADVVSDLVLMECAVYPPFISFTCWLLVKLALYKFMFHHLFCLFGGKRSQHFVNFNVGSITKLTL